METKDDGNFHIRPLTTEDVERVAHRMFGRPFSASAVGRNLDGLKLL